MKFPSLFFIFFIIFPLFIVYVCNSQVSDTWIKTFGTGVQSSGYSHHFHSMIQIPSGDFFFSGKSIIEDYESKGVPSTLGWIFGSMTSSGEILWMKYYVEVGEYYIDLIHTMDDRILVLSRKRILKFFMNGTLDWERNTDDFKEKVFFHHVSELNDGNYMICGRRYQAEVPPRCFLEKITPEGVSLWRKFYVFKDSDGGFNNENIVIMDFVSTTNDNGVVGTGSFRISKSQSAFVVLKFDQNGIFEFASEISGVHPSNDLTGISVYEMDDGGFIAAGGESYGGYHKSLINFVKLNENGIKEWGVSYFVTKHELFHIGKVFLEVESVKKTSNGIIVCSSVSDSIANFILVFELDTNTIDENNNPKLLWIKTIGEDNFKSGNNMKCTDIFVSPIDNSIYISGTTDNFNSTINALSVKLSLNDVRVCCRDSEIIRSRHTSYLYPYEVGNSSLILLNLTNESNETLKNIVNIGYDIAEYYHSTPICHGYIDDKNSFVDIPNHFMFEQCDDKFEILFDKYYSSSLCTEHLNLHLDAPRLKNHLLYYYDNNTLLSPKYIPYGRYKLDFSLKINAFDNVTHHRKSFLTIGPCNKVVFEVVIIISSVFIFVFIVVIIVILLILVPIIIIVMRKNRKKNPQKGENSEGIEMKKKVLTKYTKYFNSEKKKINSEDKDEIEMFLNSLSNSGVTNNTFESFKKKWVSGNGKLFSKIKLINFEHIKLKKYLGGGGSGGSVFLGECTTENAHREVVIKSYRILSDKMEDLFSKQNKVFREFKSELNIFLRTSHPYVLKILGIVLKQNYFGIVMEYCLCGDLKNFIKMHSGFDINERIKLLGKISSGMAHLHFNNIIHRDLKLENILITEHLDPKIMDFGISRLIVNSMTKTKNIGTVKYQAPELVLSGKYDEKVDVFSFAILAFELLTGNFDPFNEKSIDGNLSILISTDSNFRPKIEELPKSIDNWLKKLIMTCWDDAPHVRPSFTEICKLFKRNCSSFNDLKIFQEKMKKNPITIYAIVSESKEQNMEDIEMESAKDIDLEVFKVSELRRIGEFNLNVTCKDDEKMEIFLKDKSGFKKIDADMQVENLENDSIIIFTKTKS